MSKASSKSGCPLGHDFDHASIEFRDAVPEILDEIHESCPVIESEKHGGFYYFASYDDVEKIARDWKSFSSDRDPEGRGNRTGVLFPPGPSRLSFLEMDPPAQLEYRRVFSKWWSPGSISDYEPRMRKMASERMSFVRDMGRFDVVEDLANPITAMVTMDFIGLPAEQWKVYVDAVHRQSSISPEDAEFPQVIEEVGEAHGRIQGIIDSRREDPRDDLINRLMETEVDGQVLTDEEVIAAIWTTLGGGLNTTSGAMAYIMRHLTEARETRARLMEDPDLIPGAVEEYIRFSSPANISARTVTQEISLGTTKLQPGDHVLLGWKAANFDPQRFDDPQSVVIDREANRHIAFGDGAHRCPGSRFARVELKVFLEELLRLMPAFAVDTDACVEYPTTRVINGFVQMPAVSDEGV